MKLVHTICHSSKRMNRKFAGKNYIFTLVYLNYRIHLYDLPY